MSVLDIIAKTAWPQWALITGGEPLLQPWELLRLVRGLRHRGIKTEIETNGSIIPPVWWSIVDSWSADIKCPSSGMMGESKLAWFGLRCCDQVKFVVSNEEDLDFVLETIHTCGGSAPEVLISPTYPWTTEWSHRCVEFCIEQDLRLSLQQHKILYGAERRGV